MKKLFVTLFCLGMAAPLFADGTNQLANENSRVSYAIGMMTGQQWKQQNLDFDADSYARGIKDAMAGKKPCSHRRRHSRRLKTSKRNLPPRCSKNGKRWR